eukprot:6484223-Amphidinium_carterae.1
MRPKVQAIQLSPRVHAREPMERAAPTHKHWQATPEGGRQRPQVKHAPFSPIHKRIKDVLH